MDANLKKDMENLLKKLAGSPPDLINNEMSKLVSAYNTTGQHDFDGLSPEQMHTLLDYDCADPIVKIKDPKGADIPLVKQIVYYLNLIKANKEITLTQAGYLPPAVVKEIYAQKFLCEPLINEGVFKLTKEADSLTITLTNLLCQASGLIKERKRKLSLTTKGKQIMEAEYYLPPILTAFCAGINWAYFDRYENVEIGQAAAYYSIYLLAKYGNTKRNTSFYANKYFEAFFKEYAGINTDNHACYAVRTFDRFLNYFGFLEGFEENKFRIRSIKKSALFDKYIEIRKTNNGS